MSILLVHDATPWEEILIWVELFPPLILDMNSL